MQDILLLHGALGSKEQFCEIEKFLGRDFRTHTINFSGHGGEQIPAEAFRIELFSADIIKYLDKNKIESSDIFGYSMGGYAALWAAVKNPGRIGKIFTLATKFEWSEEIAVKETKMLNPQKIKEKVPAYAEQLIKRHGEKNWEKVLDSTAGMMNELGKKNILDAAALGSINNNVQVSVGDRDKMVTIEETVNAYRNLKNGKLLVLPDTPHPLEGVNAERLCYEIKRFFT